MSNTFIIGILIIVCTILLVFGFLFFISKDQSESDAEESLEESDEDEAKESEVTGAVIEYPVVDKEIEINLDMDSF